jgi:hypothetical protein
VFSIDVRARHWPGYRIRFVIVLIIVLITGRWAPGAALPLGLGACLGTWLPAGPAATVDPARSLA